MTEKDRMIGWLGDTGIRAKETDPRARPTHGTQFWPRLFSSGSRGLGEARMDDIWDYSDALDVKLAAKWTGDRNTRSAPFYRIWRDHLLSCAAGLPHGYVFAR